MTKEQLNKLLENIKKFVRAEIRSQVKNVINEELANRFLSTINERSNSNGFSLNSINENYETPQPVQKQNGNRIVNKNILVPTDRSKVRFGTNPYVKSAAEKISQKTGLPTAIFEDISDEEISSFNPDGSSVGSSPAAMDSLDYGDVNDDDIERLLQGKYGQQQ